MAALKAKRVEQAGTEKLRVIPDCDINTIRCRQQELDEEVNSLVTRVRGAEGRHVVSFFQSLMAG